MSFHACMLTVELTHTVETTITAIHQPFFHAFLATHRDILILLSECPYLRLYLLPIRPCAAAKPKPPPPKPMAKPTATKPPTVSAKPPVIAAKPPAAKPPAPSPAIVGQCIWLAGGELRGGRISTNMSPFWTGSMSLG